MRQRPSYLPFDSLPRLLLADTDPAFAAALLHAFSRAGFRTDRVRHAAELTAALQRAPYDAVLLDAALPGSGGPASVQAQRPGQVVLVLSPPVSVAERIRWLDQGADDLVTLPADADEVAAHVRAVLRRTQRAQAQALALRHGPLCLQIDRRAASWHGREVQLTSREFWVLETLVRRRHEVVSRAVLEEMLYRWSEETSSNTVEVHVHHLRRKLERQVITTLRGRGYRIGSEETLAAATAG